MKLKWNEALHILSYISFLPWTFCDVDVAFWLYYTAIGQWFSTSYGWQIVLLETSIVMVAEHQKLL